MPMNLQGNYVYPGLSYPLYTLPLPNDMAQPSGPYHNPHMLYYAATNPAYAAMPAVYPPSDLYSSPTFLSHLKSIADNILASDAKTRKRGSKPKIPSELTPLVRMPVTETLDELRTSTYYRYHQMASTTMLPVEYPNTLEEGPSLPVAPTESITIPSDNEEEEYIDVEDIGEDIPPLAPPPIAQSPDNGQNLSDKTEGGLPRFVATFNEEPRYTVTSASTNMLLMNSFAATPPLSDGETEKGTGEYPRRGAFTKGNETYAQLLGQGLKKSLDETGEKVKIEQRPLSSGTSSVELHNAVFPERPHSEPLPPRTQSDVHDDAHNKKRPIRPRSEPAVVYDKSSVSHREPKNMRADNNAGTTESTRKHANPADPVQRKSLTHAIEALVDCGVKSQRAEYQTKSQKHEASTGALASYAKRNAFAHEPPRPSAALAKTAPNAKKSLRPTPLVVKPPTETDATPPTPEIPQPSPDTGTARATKAWPWFGLPSVSELMSFTPQVAPDATGTEAGTPPSSEPPEAPRSTATRTSGWSWTVPPYEEVPAKPAEAFKTQFTPGTAPSYTSGTSMAHAEAKAAETTKWTWKWSAVAPHDSNLNPSAVNLTPHISGEGWIARAEQVRSMSPQAQLITPMQSAAKHNATPNSQVPTPQRVPLDQTKGLPSKGFSEANHRNQLLGKKPNAKRKFGSPKIEVSPKHPRARKPRGVSSSQPPKQRRVFPDEAQSASQMQKPTFTSIGARGTLVRRDFYDIIAWDDYVQCTKLLMQFIFNFHSLATLTVDGSDRLDADIVHDIATHVSVKCGIPVEQVHHAMRHVCSVARKCFEESKSS